MRQRLQLQYRRLWTNLALQELKTCTTTCADVAELVLRAVLCDDGRGIAATHNDGSTFLCGLDGRVKERLGRGRERFELEDTRGARHTTSNSPARAAAMMYSPVPEDGLCLQNRLAEQFTTLRASVETHPVIRNTLSVRGKASLFLYEHMDHRISYGMNEPERPCRTCPQ